MAVERVESFLFIDPLGGVALGGGGEGGRGFPLFTASRLGGSAFWPSFEGFNSFLMSVNFPPFQFRLLGGCLSSV